MLVGIQLGWVRMHMVKKHKFKKMMALTVKRGIQAAQRVQKWDLYSKRIPDDGLKPQEGMTVFDGARCRYC